MMKRLFAITVAVLISASVFAQAPESMSYQAVVRDNNDNLMANTAIGMQISILQGSITGSAVFVERHFPTTNANGLVSLEIGSGTLISGSFAAVDWENGPYFIETETDVNGGANYTITGTSQLLSVPYALHANTADSLVGGLAAQTLSVSNDSLTISGGNTVVLPTSTTTGAGDKTYLVLAGDITDAEAVTRLQNDFGPNTQFLWIIGTTQLTTVDLTGFGCTELVEIKIRNNQALTTITLPELTNVWYVMECADNTALTNINLPVLEGVADNFYCNSNDILASLSLPALTSLGGNFHCSDNSALASLSLPALASVMGSFMAQTNPALASLSLPVLASAGGVNCEYNDTLASLSLPALTSLEAFFCSNNPALASLSFPVLASVTNNFNCIDNPVLASVSLPALDSVGGNFYCKGNPTLASLSLPVLASVGSYFECRSNDILASLSLPALASVAVGGSSFNCQFNAMPSATINSLLGTLVAISPALTGKYISLDGQTPSAPPTGQGITDKATLIANGNNVYTD